MILTQRMQNFSALKKELEQEGRKYAREAISFRDKIAELTLGFIKDDSVVSKLVGVTGADAYRSMRVDPYPFLLTCGVEGTASCPQDEAHISLCHGITTSRPRVASSNFFLRECVC